MFSCTLFWSFIGYFVKPKAPHLGGITKKISKPLTILDLFNEADYEGDCSPVKI